MTEPSLSGRCLCGGIRFELTEPPQDAGYCHCTRCQRRTGGGSSAQARIDGRTFRLLEGEELVKCWRHPDGGFEKCFCRRCGAHLFARNPDDPTQMSVRIGAFDGDPGVPLTWRAFVAYAVPWEPIPDDGLERYDEGKAARLAQRPVSDGTGRGRSGSRSWRSGSRSGARSRRSSGRGGWDGDAGAP